MKIRAIGTGSDFCRHPLVTSSFLLQTDSSNIVIGCGPAIPAKLETINLHMDQIDMWIPLSPDMCQIGGLIEVAFCVKKPPLLVAPKKLLEAVSKNIAPFLWNRPAEELFECKSVVKVGISEEHVSETLCFVESPDAGSYSLLMPDAGVMISGPIVANDTYLHQHGSDMQTILHDFVPGLDELPVYLQKKIWLYGYGNKYQDEIEPLPMLFLPQGTCVYDSVRKDKHLEKERFVRENTKRLAGNQASSGE